MSFKAFVWAWDQDVPNGDYHHVLLALANIAPVRTVRASVPYIAALVRRSPRKVRAAIDWMDQMGIVAITRRPGFTDEIRLNIPADFKVYMDADEDQEHEAGQRGRPRKTPAPLAKPSQNPCTLDADEPIEPQEPNSVTVRAPDPFDAWWKAYPKKTAKEDARRAWRRVHKLLAEDGLTLADLMDRTRAYADHMLEQEDRFIMHGATYLNGKRWNDHLPDRSQTDGRHDRSAGGAATGAPAPNTLGDAVVRGLRQASAAGSPRRRWALRNE